MDKYMNQPEKPDEVIFAETVWHDGARWVRCPVCGKRQFSLTPITKIEHLWYKCKNSKCKTDMMVNIK